MTGQLTSDKSRQSAVMLSGMPSKKKLIGTSRPRDELVATELFRRFREAFRYAALTVGVGLREVAPFPVRHRLKVRDVPTLDRKFRSNAECDNCIMSQNAGLIPPMLDKPDYRA